ncbi:MAG: hypothetical protein EXS15_03775 [Phycisphaerales bacterium]|nr:hypothetical protein [Phycisphaerales bacterium]
MTVNTIQSRRQWKKPLAIVALSIVAVTALCIGCALNGTIFGAYLAHRLGDATGGDVTIQSFRWTGWGKAEIRGLTLAAREWSEPTRDIAKIDRLRIDLDLFSLVVGPTTIHDLDISGLRLTAVEDATHGGIYNFQTLAHELSGASTRSAIIVDRARLEGIDISFHRMQRTDKVQLLSFLAAAHLRPSSIDPMQSLLELTQVNGPIQVTGEWNQNTLAFKVLVVGLSIGEELSLILPRNYRALVAQAQTSGQVNSVRLSMSPGEPLHGVVEVADFRATLPHQGLGDWVRYEGKTISPAQGDPQIRLRTGIVEVTGPRLDFRDLDFELVNTAPDGRVATLPVRATLGVDLTTLNIEEFDWEDRAKWVAKVLDRAAFHLLLKIPSFSLGSTAQETAIEVPRSAAEFMKTFQVTQLKFDLDFTASRAAATHNADGSVTPSPVESSGVLSIMDGRGAFEDFPYPLHHIQATVRFSGSSADIAGLTGIGPDGEPVTLHGKITNMGVAAGVELEIAAESAPIDDTLFDSFPAQERRLLAGLFWQEGFESLQAAGVLFDAAQVANAVDELKTCENRLAALTQTDSHDNDAQQISQLAIRAGRLDRIIAHGAFTPGGRIAFKFTLLRPAIEDADVSVEGDIRLLHADILTTTFPYPIRAMSGAITIRNDRMDFGEGIPFETLDGAKGLFEGEIDLIESPSSERTPTRLEFVLKDDRLNPLLWLAIPPEAGEALDGWPGSRLSRGGATLARLDPTGTISLDGKISIANDGDFDVTCDIHLRDGSIHPVVSADEIIEDKGIIWPVGFGLDDCKGTFRLEDDAVIVRSFTGERRGGEIAASGRASLDGQSTDLTIQLHDMELSEYAINLLPFEERHAAADLWERYSPSGKFDAEIVLKTPLSGGPTESSLSLTPRTFGISLSGGPVEARFSSGSLSIHDQVVECDALTGFVGPSGGNQSEICMDGSYGNATGRLELGGSITHGLIHGPLIADVVDQLGADGMRHFIREYSPEGQYSAEFSFSNGADSHEGSFALTAWIDDLSLGSAEGRFAITFPDALRIEAKGTDLKVWPFRGHFPGGSIDGAGWLSTDAGGTIEQGECAFDLLAMGTGSDVVAALPKDARDSFHKIGFSCPDILRANTIIQLSNKNGRAHTEVRSDIALHGASLSAGQAVSRLSANVELLVSSDATATSFQGKLSQGTMTVAGRHIDGFSATLRKSAESQDLVIESMQGAMGGGAIAGEARIEMAQPHRYEVDLALLGVPMAALAIPADGVNAMSPAPAAQPGVVKARVGIGGDGTGIATRRGRGAASITEARLAQLPIAVAILQITQLSLALNTVVKEGDFEFTIDQDRLHFDQFKLTCDDVLLTGNGWLNTETTELALRLRNRGTLPFVSDVLGGVTNQLFQIDVRGTLGDPVGSLAPLPVFVPAPELHPLLPIAHMTP